jgi:hypothetical protein
VTSLPTIPIAPHARLPLVLTNPSRALVALNLLIYLLLSQNIVYILYSKYTPLTDTILSSSTTLGKCFVYLTKSTDLSSQKGILICQNLYTLC